MAINYVKNFYKYFLLNDKFSKKYKPNQWLKKIILILGSLRTLRYSLN